MGGYYVDRQMREPSKAKVEEHAIVRLHTWRRSLVLAVFRTTAVCLPRGGTNIA